MFLVPDLAHSVPHTNTPVVAYGCLIFLILLLVILVYSSDSMFFTDVSTLVYLHLFYSIFTHSYNRRIDVLIT